MTAIAGIATAIRTVQGAWENSAYFRRLNMPQRKEAVKAFPMNTAAAKSIMSMTLDMVCPQAKGNEVINGV